MIATTGPNQAAVREVGPRDGFQIQRKFISTVTKIGIVNALSRTGLRHIQVTSFVHPAAIPQLADAEEVFAGIDRVDGVRYSALVANARGAARAAAAEVDEIEVVISATDSHGLSNTNATTAEALRRLDAVVNASGGIPITLALATSLGCPFEGYPSYERIEGIVRQAVGEFGFSMITIADTVGMAPPTLVASTMSDLRSTFPGITFVLHLHDTRRMGLANVLAGWQAGVVHFDSSVAGLGGCPYAPGASGNVATEDLVNMLHEMGIETGVDLNGLVAVAESVVASVAPGDSGVLRAGPSSRVIGRYTGRQKK